MRKYIFCMSRNKTRVSPLITLNKIPDILARDISKKKNKRLTNWKG
jgi:hypothetical protein